MLRNGLAFVASSHAPQIIPRRDAVRVAARHRQSLGFGANLRLGNDDRRLLARNVVHCGGEENVFSGDDVSPVSRRRRCEIVRIGLGDSGAQGARKNIFGVHSDSCGIF